MLLYTSISTSALNVLKTAVLEFSSRTPSESANATALFVTKAAWSNTPATPIGTVDTELAVEVTVSVGPRGGKRKSTAFRAPSAIQRTNRTVPLAYLIIAARANPNSRYNQLTGGRWQLDHGPGKNMLAFARRMLGSRHSSTHFIQAGWIPIIIDLEQVVPKYATRGSTRGPTASAKSGASDQFGHAIPAQSGATVAVAVIEDRIGLTGPNGIINEKRNQALWHIAAPALQLAIDQEAEKTVQFIYRESFKRQFTPLAAQGFIIDV